MRAHRFRAFAPWWDVRAQRFFIRRSRSWRRTPATSKVSGSSKASSPSTAADSSSAVRPTRTIPSNASCTLVHRNERYDASGKPIVVFIQRHELAHLYPERLKRLRDAGFVGHSLLGGFDDRAVSAGGDELVVQLTRPWYGRLLHGLRWLGAGSGRCLGCARAGWAGRAQVDVADQHGLRYAQGHAADLPAARPPTASP